MVTCWRIPVFRSKRVCKAWLALTNNFNGWNRLHEYEQNNVTWHHVTLTAGIIEVSFSLPLGVAIPPHSACEASLQLVQRDLYKIPSCFRGKKTARHKAECTGLLSIRRWLGASWLGLTKAVRTQARACADKECVDNTGFWEREWCGVAAMPSSLTQHLAHCYVSTCLFSPALLCRGTLVTWHRSQWEFRCRFSLVEMTNAGFFAQCAIWHPTLYGSKSGRTLPTVPPSQPARSHCDQTNETWATDGKQRLCDDLVGLHSPPHTSGGGLSWVANIWRE